MSRVWEQFCSQFAAELEADATWNDAFRLAMETSPGVPRLSTVPTEPAELAAWLNRVTSPPWPMTLLADALEIAPDRPQLWAVAARRVVVLLDAQDELSDEWQRQVRPVRRSAWLWLAGVPTLAVCGVVQGWSLLSGGLGQHGSPVIAVLSGALAVAAAVWWWLLLAEADRQLPRKSLRTLATDHHEPKPSATLSVIR